MSTSKLDFTIDIPAQERNDLLQLAANEIYALSQDLSDDGKGKASDQASMLKTIMDEAVILPEKPVMHKITDDKFIADKYNLPIDIKKVLDSYNFYWLQVPVGVFPKERWAFSRIETGIVLETKDGQDIPRAIRILPEKEFQDLFKTEVSGEVGLDSNFNFSGKTADYHFEYKGNKLDMSAKAAAAGAFNGKLVFGPLSFKIRSIKIDQNGKNTNIVRWTLNDTNAIQDGFDLIAVLQIPKSYKDFKVYAEVRARKNLNDFPSILDLMQYLTEKAKLILKTGCPKKDAKEWDLTAYL
jgi:hypothetical protein